MAGAESLIIGGRQVGEKQLDASRVPRLARMFSKQNAIKLNLCINSKSRILKNKISCREEIIQSCVSGAKNKEGGRSS